MSTSAMAASALAAASSSGVEVGERKSSVSDRIADSSSPAMGLGGVMFCSPYIRQTMVAVQPTGSLRKIHRAAGLQAADAVVVDDLQDLRLVQPVHGLGGARCGPPG